MHPIHSSQLKTAKSWSNGVKQSVFFKVVTVRRGSVRVGRNEKKNTFSNSMTGKTTLFFNKIKSTTLIAIYCNRSIPKTFLEHVIINF